MTSRKSHGAAATPPPSTCTTMMTPHSDPGANTVSASPQADSLELSHHFHLVPADRPAPSQRRICTGDRGLAVDSESARAAHRARLSPPCAPTRATVRMTRIQSNSPNDTNDTDNARSKSEPDKSFPPSARFIQTIGWVRKHAPERRRRCDWAAYSCSP